MPTEPGDSATPVRDPVDPQGFAPPPKASTEGPAPSRPRVPPTARPGTFRWWTDCGGSRITIASTFALGLWRRFLANRVLLFLSTISYNLYIWHQSLGVLIRERQWWKADTPTPMEDPNWRWSYMIVAVAASIAVASLITYGFERPLLRRGVKGTIRACLAKWSPLEVRRGSPGASGE